MPTYQLLTDRTLANVTAITPTTLIHIVTTADTTQSIYGSSYKAELQQLLTIFKDSFVSGATYNNNLFTFTNTTGGTFNVLFNTVTGLTVNGNLIVTGTTLSNTISATTYQNLPTDVRVTGGTYSNGTATFTNSTGGTFNVTGFFTGSTDVRVTGATYSNNSFTYRNNTGGTFSVLFNTVTGLTTNGNLTVTGTTSSNTISATTYQNLPTDIRITGATYSNNVFTHRNNTGGTYTVLFNTVTGLTVNGNLVVTGNTGLGTTSPSYTLDVSSGVENTDEIALRVANNGNKGVYFAPTANSSSFNQNTISGDTVIVGSPGESLVIGSNTGYAGLRFSGGSGALAMTSSGWLGLGSQYLGDPTEQPSQQLDVEGNARFRAVGATAFFAPLNITSDGKLTTATSDVRLKENIEPLTNSLEKLLQLSGVTYSWIGQEEKRIGFIAQEVEKVIPELVFTNNNTEDKIKGIHLDNITAVLVEAIKEQQKIIEELKVRISNLES
jgi:hypothetical protein